MLDINNIVEIHRDNLLKPVKRAYKLLTEEEANTCASKLHETFEKWKTEHGVEPLPISKGLLDVGKIISFEDAKPYQCASYGVNNYTDLALKLWLDGYTPFENLCTVYGTQGVLAVVYEDIDTSNNIEGLVRLSCLLYEIEVNVNKKTIERLITVDILTKRSKTNKHLKGLNSGGREKGVETNKLRAQQRKIAWRRIAIDMFRREPGASYDKIAYYIQGTSHGIMNNTGKKYSERTIKDAIKGTKNEA